MRVERNGDAVVVDVDAQMPGTLRETWAVFTDYENMASFITNLTASKIVARKEHSLEVMQAGSTKVGFMTFGFEACLLYTSPSPRDGLLSRMPSSA